jgi:hypothetical protein
MVHAVIPVLRRWRQEDHKLETSLCNIARSCLKKGKNKRIDSEE